MLSINTALMRSAILSTLTQYLADGAESAMAINNGQCEDFAIDVKAALHPSVNASILPSEGFMQPDHRHWDWPLLTGWGIQPPEGMTPEQVDMVPVGGHTFLHADGKFFDSECPEGTYSFFDLPFYRRAYGHK